MRSGVEDQVHATEIKGVLSWTCGTIDAIGPNWTIDAIGPDRTNGERQSQQRQWQTFPV